MLVACLVTSGKSKRACPELQGRARKDADSLRQLLLEAAKLLEERAKMSFYCESHPILGRDRLNMRNPSGGHFPFLFKFIRKFHYQLSSGFAQDDLRLLGELALLWPLRVKKEEEDGKSRGQGQTNHYSFFPRVSKTCLKTCCLRGSDSRNKECKT